ncbi:acyl-[acyl-carrier-protein] thioesterase [Leptospira sp. 2 VSF19]|uniref:Acyl-[acyl-carrier-protein] thioesterase n=1 Tax=Leptospira soteropolitanensis TaxID=2950025 RepID=A0AAW5VFS8_9LEPT|nr:acyl-[acyl-carrier-protein] thioesterase [Leptospira soteropolitanensis]MCW7493798.1 acyl-[acyl-carrier-protein] thioesterase [Leptospira soteropolitanensis]MCW7501395.1 acyl-[acyl-carrier-protein] thioesterase [Leptospira soteropolitanensis]MCW7523419.1 acyl-[acyl-carrier-protein] thioesterase [Leptospira soteropolitanensis]MCW7527509.1 acyl-[acyl-carrier-protein] thioesterase [Leptospira soteropolitanensis]MCW7531365.1 acyl-[acyl-carrier-protein] thioesterase [Leptospira soteropolitanensi
MSQIFRKTLTTRHFDLDWNRHVTSRTYERFAYDARCEVLREFGYPIELMLNNNISYIPGSTNVRFLSQQFVNSDLTVETQVYRLEDGILLWKQTIFGSDEKKACEIETRSRLVQDGKNIRIANISEININTYQFTIHPMPTLQNTVEHDYYIPFSDMNCFWNLPSDSIWKIFEEGRFLFFKEIVDLNLIKETDSTTFFMGGEILIYKQPDPGSHVKILSWIESFEKIRFYFRQDIIDLNGNLLASMKDEQLFVSLSNSRPRRAPAAFFDKIERFIE